MEVDAARLHPVILSAQAEVDHHDPAIADDLVLDQIDVVQNRHCDSGRSGFRHETCFVADARPAQRIVERLETIRFGFAMLFDGGPTQELRSSDLGLRAPLDEHTARCEAAEKNLSSFASLY